MFDCLCLPAYIICFKENNEAKVKKSTRKVSIVFGVKILCMNLQEMFAHDKDNFCRGECLCMTKFNMVTKNLKEYPYYTGVSY